MKSLTNGTHIAERRSRQQILRLPGPRGQRRHAREIVSFDVSHKPRRSTLAKLWRGRFVAGDRLVIVACHPDGGSSAAQREGLRAQGCWGWAPEIEPGRR